MSICKTPSYLVVPRINNRVVLAFEIVHSDVWDHVKFVSKMGHKYSVTFVDDFSLVTWIYFIKSQSEVFTHFSTYIAEIKIKFNSSYSKD